MEYNEKLKELRLQHNMSQEQLAEQMHVTRQTVSKWEQGINQPDIFTLKQYSQIFGVTLDELVGEGISVQKRVGKISTASKILFIVSTLFHIACVLTVFVLLRFLENTLPMHYNASGEMDRYGNKVEILLYLLPFTVFYGLALGTYLIGKKNIGTKLPNLETPSYIVIFSTVLAAQMGFFVFTLCYTVNYLQTDKLMPFIFCIVGVIECVLSIATHPKITPTNAIIGFRTNFTLTNPVAWKKMNSFCSICIFVAAILMIAVNMIFPSLWVSLGSCLILFVALTILFIYHSILKNKLTTNNVSE